MKISIWREHNGELAACDFHNGWIDEGNTYVINRVDSSEDKTVLLICEDCFNMLIELKQKADNAEEYEEIIQEV